MTLVGIRPRHQWTLRDVWRALRTPRWRKRKLAQLRWRVGLLPDVFVARSPRFEAYLVVAGNGLEWASWREMYAADPCVYCAGPSGTIDHIMPRSRGGKSAGWENAAPACEDCNTAKGARPLLLHLTGRRGTSRRRAFLKSRSGHARGVQRAFVKHLLKPERCPPPLRHPLGARLMAALEKRRDEEGRRDEL